MIAVQKKNTTTASARRGLEIDKTEGIGVPDSAPVFCVAGNRFLRIAPLPRIRMSDIPLQKSRTGLTSVDVLADLREDTC